MNLNNLQTKLIAAARATPPNDRVPYAFEKRVMAHLTGAGRADLLGAWSTALWRAAISCVAIVVLSGAWSLWSSHEHSQAEFSQEFETAVFASAGAVDDAQ
jgi:hypothetical protein